MPRDMGYGNPGPLPGQAPSPADALAILGDEGEPEVGMQDELTTAIVGLDENQRMQVLEFINSLKVPVEGPGAPLQQAQVPPPPLGV